MTQVTKAVVLARGLGTRMREVDVALDAGQAAESSVNARQAAAAAAAAADTSLDAAHAASASLDARQAAMADRGIKAMMPIGPGGRPFLDFILSGLADAGYAEACLVIGPGPDHQLIRDYYTTFAPPRRIRVAFAVQVEPRGTADALLAAESFAGDEHVLVVNGDNYYPVDGLRALRMLDSAGTVLFDPVSLVRASNIPAERLRAFAIGLVDADGVLVELIEKPDEETWHRLGLSGPLTRRRQASGVRRQVSGVRPQASGDMGSRASFAGEALVSMNCWRVPPAIFDICRALTPSSRGELELPHAIHNAILDGVRFVVVRSDAGVLDLSRRGDVPAVAERLRHVRVEV